MYALRRNDVEALNTLARRELRRRGELEVDVISVGNRSFAEKDEVIFLRNDGRLGVLNGTRGVVSGAGDDTLMVNTERGCVEVPYSYLSGRSPRPRLRVNGPQSPRRDGRACLCARWRRDVPGGRIRIDE